VKNRISYLILGILVIGSLISCEKPFEPSEGITIISPRQNEQIYPDNDLVVRYNYDKINTSDFNKKIRVQIMKFNCAVVRNDLPLFNLDVGSSGTGSGSVIWDGLIYQNVGGFNFKLVPVQLGLHTVRAIIEKADVTSQLIYTDERTINVIPAPWDQDNDYISDAVEDENAGIGGGPVTTISYQGQTQILL
jgi:hypothetical protein